jgi:hypothetical protein
MSPSALQESASDIVKKAVILDRPAGKRSLLNKGEVLPPSPCNALLSFQLAVCRATLTLIGCPESKLHPSRSA